MTRRLWLAAALVLICLAILALAVPAGLVALWGMAISAFALQVLLASLVVAARPRKLSISSFFALVWIIYFPLRLLVITFGPVEAYYFANVRGVSASELIDLWEMTTAALLLFFVGQLAVARYERGVRSGSRILSYQQILIVGIVGIVVTGTATSLHISSGILSNVEQFALFGIAGAAYLETKDGRRPYASMVIVLAAVSLGYLNGFKELMLLPVGAWVIGRVGAGGRLPFHQVALAAVAVVITFGVVQGERAAALDGSQARDPIEALQIGLAGHDLASGSPADYHGIGIAGNVANGILYRLKGADYLIAIMSKVPSLIPYQSGRSLWEPAFSVLPGAKQFLEPQYQQLSLGRYVDQTFVSEQPTEDQSSQSMTAPGDLYLNFGVAGVFVGMLILGLIYAGFDRAVPVEGPVSAGVAAFAGLPLLALDGNLAYILVTSMIRLGLCAVLLALVVRPARVHLTRTMGGEPFKSRTA